MRDTAVVVGAGPGLGVDVARRFAREGYAVALVARDAHRLERAVGGVAEAAGGRAGRESAAAFPRTWAIPIRCGRPSPDAAPCSRRAVRWRCGPTSGGQRPPSRRRRCARWCSPSRRSSLRRASRRTVTIMGLIGSEGFAPDRPAEGFWRVHLQPHEQWAAEVVYRGIARPVVVSALAVEVAIRQFPGVCASALVPRRPVRSLANGARGRERNRQLVEGVPAARPATSEPAPY